ncbi:MAG: FimV/HubP family polar landmark protein, partial [Chromatiaceae bacterium]
LVDDPTPSPGERSSARPGAQTLRAGASNSPQAQDELDLSGLLAEQEGLASSELLSSQWQMDSGLWDETATKLDLARAYVEMDDPESARGILEEVIAEGSDAQRSEARELLQGLG